MKRRIKVTWRVKVDWGSIANKIYKYWNRYFRRRKWNFKINIWINKHITERWYRIKSISLAPKNKNTKSIDDKWKFRRKMNYNWGGKGGPYDSQTINFIILNGFRFNSLKLCHPSILTISRSKLSSTFYCKIQWLNLW